MTKEWQTYAQLAGSMRTSDSEPEEKPHGMSDYEELKRIGMAQQESLGEEYNPEKFAQELGLS